EGGEAHWPPRTERRRPPARLADLRPRCATPCVRTTAGEDVEERGESLGTITVPIEVADDADAGRGRRPGQHRGATHVRGPSRAQLQNLRTRERHIELFDRVRQPLQRVGNWAIAPIHAEGPAPR